MDACHVSLFPLGSYPCGTLPTECVVWAGVRRGAGLPSWPSRGRRNSYFGWTVLKWDIVFKCKSAIKKYGRLFCLKQSDCEEIHFVIMSKTSVSCCRYIYRRKHANKLAAAFLSFNTIWHSWLPSKLCSGVRRWAGLKPDPPHTPHFSCSHLDILGVRVRVGATVNHLSTSTIPCQLTNYPSQRLHSVRSWPGRVHWEAAESCPFATHTASVLMPLSWAWKPPHPGIERSFAKQCEQH